MPILEESLPSAFDDVVQTFNDAALAEAIEPAAVWMRRRADIRDELAELLKRGTDVRPMADNVAGGWSLRDAAIEQAATAAMFAGSVPMVRHLANRAMFVCFDNARRWFRENVDELGGLVDEMVAEVQKDRVSVDRTLDGTGSLEVAVAKGKRYTDAWQRRVELNSVVARLGEARAALGRLVFVAKVVA
jgi:hypothetical protein